MIEKLFETILIISFYLKKIFCKNFPFQIYVLFMIYIKLYFTYLLVTCHFGKKIAFIK